MLSSDFPGYPSRYPEPIFHYPRVTGLPVHTKKKCMYIFFKVYGFLYIYSIYFQTV